MPFKPHDSLSPGEANLPSPQHPAGWGSELPHRNLRANHDCSPASDLNGDSILANQNLPADPDSNEESSCDRASDLGELEKKTPEGVRAYLRVIGPHSALDGEFELEEEWSESQSAIDKFDNGDLSEAQKDSIFAGSQVTEWESDLWEDPKLAEIASQLSIDANYLSACFPSGSSEDRVALVSQEPAVPRQTRKRTHSTRRPLTRRLRHALATISIAVLLVVLGKPILDQSLDLRQPELIGQSNAIDGLGHETSQHGNASAMAANRAIGEAFPPANLASDNFDLLPNVYDERFPHVASSSAASLAGGTPSPTRNASLTGSSRTGSVMVTPVIYQPEVLFHASQAELEGILDIVRPDQDGKIRVAF